MKQSFTEIAKSIIDGIFSFWTFWLIMVGLVVMILIQAGETEARAKVETQQLTEACYSQGMVLVQSDAGQRCVLPQSLVKVK
jgi:hypothetical protein